MNKQITQLDKQAKIWAMENTNYPISTYIPPGYTEKFAELIVRECIGLIRKQSIGEEILGGQRYKTVQLGETIATITEHFGVE